MRTVRPIHLPIGALILMAVILAACTAASRPTATAPTTASPAAIATASPVPGLTDPMAPHTGPDAMLLVGRDASPQLQLVRTATGETIMDVPVGAFDSSWSRVVTATPLGAQTLLSDEAINGSASPSLQLDGRWRLPTIGTDPLPAGVSADGSTIALVQTTDASSDAAPASSSRFAIVRHTHGGQQTTTRSAGLRLATMIELPAGFEFDALSPNGSVLYVIEHLKGSAGAYQVRAVDVATGTMRPDAVADKRNLGEAMAGWPVAQVRRSDGIVLTLYRGGEHPFVHALNTSDGWAICLDLPGSSAADESAARDWALASSPDGKTVFAINGTLGLAADIDPAGLTIRRTSILETASVDGASSGGIELAKFGHDPVGPAGRSVVSSDGKTLWAGGADGLLAVGTSDLAVRSRMIPGTAVDGIAVTPDGSTVFALLRDGGRIMALDASTGKTLGTLSGDGFDRLLGVAGY
jgi:hypothetical protein